jgi:hypothetical protein
LGEAWDENSKVAKLAGGKSLFGRLGHVTISWCSCVARAKRESSEMRH